MIAGLFAGLYGVFFSVKQMSTNLAQGSGGEFRAITCCAIGGIAMTGGKGSIYGVGLGTLLFYREWRAPEHGCRQQRAASDGWRAAGDSSIARYHTPAG